MVEDERAQREAIAQFLTRRGYEVVAVASGEAALDEIERRPASVLITDLRLPGMSGLELIQRARDLDDLMGTLLVTAFASVESAVEALRLGVQDYLMKPVILEDLARKVDRLITERELILENARLRRALHAHREGSEIVCVSAAMQAVRAQLERLARVNTPVLFVGERGSGKERLARYLHACGHDPTAPFLVVDPQACRDVEKELFGTDSERGALSEAPGTVFVEAVDTLPPEVQRLLSMALDTCEFKPVGSRRTRPLGVRILASSRRTVEELEADGALDRELFDHLRVAIVRVPPLRERREDIPRLVRALVEEHARRAGVPVPFISADALRGLTRHPWPGNVRELSNVLERALIFAEDGRIVLEDMPEDVRDASSDGFALGPAVERFERAHIATVLRLCGGNRERAAAELGISPATLYRRLERLGLKGYEVSR